MFHRRGCILCVFLAVFPLLMLVFWLNSVPYFSLVHVFPTFSSDLLTWMAPQSAPFPRTHHKLNIQYGYCRLQHHGTLHTETFTFIWFLIDESSTHSINWAFIALTPSLLDNFMLLVFDVSCFPIFMILSASYNILFVNYIQHVFWLLLKCFLDHSAIYHL